MTTEPKETKNELEWVREKLSPEDWHRFCADEAKRVIRIQEAAERRGRQAAEDEAVKVVGQEATSAMAKVYMAGKVAGRKEGAEEGIKMGWKEAALCASAAYACGKDALGVADEVKKYADAQD